MMITFKVYIQNFYVNGQHINDYQVKIIPKGIRSPIP
jgi:hypothetical protein